MTRSDSLQLATSALLLLVFALVAPPPARPLAAVDPTIARTDALTVDSILVDGVFRTFAYRTPPKGARHAPLVLALHGGGGSATRLRMFIGGPLEEHAAALGAVVVYPDGIGGSWNDCRAAAPYAANVQAVDDVGFIRALVARLSERLGIDHARVFAIGLSNGAQLALRLAVEAPDLISGAAAFAATWPPEHASDCLPPATAPAPVMLVNGTADPLSPWNGGMSRGPDGTELGEVMSADETASWLRGLAGYPDGAPAPALERRQGPDGIDVTIQRWSAHGRPPILQVTVHGGGHAVPGPEIALPEAVVGPIARHYDGIGAALDFFLKRPAR